MDDILRNIKPVVLSYSAISLLHSLFLDTKHFVKFRDLLAHPFFNKSESSNSESEYILKNSNIKLLFINKNMSLDEFIVNLTTIKGKRLLITKYYLN